MSKDDEPDGEGRGKWSPWAIAAAILLLLIFGVVGVGTFRGYFFVSAEDAAKQEDERKKKEEEEKKQKHDFEISTPIVMPSDPKSQQPFVKPGHWESTSQMMLANYREFVGDSRLSIVNAQNQPYPVAKTPFELRASRPVLLSKGRPKSTETTIFIPNQNQNLNLYNELEERGLGYGMPPIRTPLTAMPSYQYNFVVLAKEPSRYSFIKFVDSVEMPFAGESEMDDTTHPVIYRVVLMPAGTTVALPDNPLTWTSTAYMLWDNVDPGDPISPEQKKALVDWVHWGGQLVINGPSSLDLLKGSFLEPYLPATNGGARKITADDPAVAELNKGWLISTSKVPGEALKLNVPWSGVQLKLQPGGSFMPNTGELLAERQVGRGRIVVTAMQLSERDLMNWRSGFEGFFNSCILRRHARKYKAGVYLGDPTIVWADEKLKDHRLDAALNTSVRYFSRDLGVETSYHREDVNDDAIPNPRYNQTGQRIASQEYKPPTNAGGLGAWSDFSATADAARTSLHEAAGVEVPGSNFVVMCLVAYLTTLVPINWIVFRTLGRVEWAWIAAPIIAIAGTWVIVQRARLDIGFVRAHTEIGILEQQPDHPRAHLSRFTALYTSLSTTYDFQFPNLTTLVAPFPTSSKYEMLTGQNLTGVNYQRYDDVRLVGLPISSNSTGMVHSEEMQALDGPIRFGKSAALGGNQIENRSKLDLHSVCVIRKPTEDEVNRKTHRMEGRWIGELSAGQSAAFAGMTTLPEKEHAFGEERTAEAQLISTPRLNLEPLFHLALNLDYMEPGETRLVARCDEVQPGEVITPQASQVRGATLVVVHLSYAPPPALEKDVNTSRDIKTDSKKSFDDESIQL